MFVAQYPDYDYTVQPEVPTGALATIGLVGLLIVVVMIAAMWKIFTKAGQPGWAAIIPIYNTYVLCKVVGRPGWWVILSLIPFVNFVVMIILSIDLAKSFGKDALYAVLLILLPIVGYPLLGFGKAAYAGPAAAPRVPAAV